jgi:spermidine synthase
MAFEMVGSRILAPEFGNTIFVWGSLIGIFLGALSLGYFVGGRLADRAPRFVVLGAIIAAAGLIILVVPLYAPACCGWVDSFRPGRRINPLLASVLLFFVPSVLLGMVSPFSVRLQARSVATVGNVAGRLYALSTLGSIAGTILATFWLVPSYGASNVVKALGGSLVVVSLLAIVPRLLQSTTPGRARAAAGAGSALLCALVLAIVPSPSFIPLEADEKLVEEVDSPYQHIGVVLLPWRYGEGPEEWSMRLVFDEYIESEVLVESGDPENIRIKEPFTSGAKYTDMLHLPFLFSRDAKRVLIVGGGGCVVPSIFSRDYPQLTAIDIVEIDRFVLDIAERYFGFRPTDERITTTLMDGRIYIRDCKKQYDIIILDAFTGGRPPFHLLTKEFLELVKARLGPRGVVHLNIISALEGEKGRLYRAMLKTFNAVFGRDHVYVFPKWYDPKWPLRSGPEHRLGINIELIATNFDDFQNPLPKSEIIKRADELVGPLIKIPSITQHARNHLPDEPDRDLSADPVLTDDYAPVDNMVTD